MADSDSEWWEELLVVEPTRCSALAPAPGPLLPDPVPVVESGLSVQSVRSMPSPPAPGPILQDPVPIVESLLSVQSVCSMPSAPAPGPKFSGSSSAAYSQVDGNFIADRSAKLRHIHLAI